MNLSIYIYLPCCKRARFEIFNVTLIVAKYDYNNSVYNIIYSRDNLGLDTFQSRGVNRNSKQIIIIISSCFSLVYEGFCSIFASCSRPLCLKNEIEPKRNYALSCILTYTYGLRRYSEIYQCYRNYLFSWNYKLINHSHGTTSKSVDGSH